MYFHREIYEQLLANADFKKALIILGPRQVGKATLIQKVAEQISPAYLYLNGDEFPVQQALQNANLAFLKAFVGDYKCIVIDEAQRIPNIGLTVKIMLDNIQGIQLMVTGSSSLELASTINEPLTGRKWEYQLFPLSWNELVKGLGLMHSLASLSNLLIFGLYPEVVTSAGQEIPVLSNLASSYLYRDLLNYQGIRRPELLSRILQALAWQVGSEVSFNKLSQTVQADKNTVQNYIDLLEKSFIIKKLNPFSRNLRGEINKSRKIYFVDNGILNSVTGNYSPLPNRSDVGGLWENFLIGERQKMLRYNGFYGRVYFWRNVAGQEIDYLEEIDGKIYPFEFKWNPKAHVKFPKVFAETYHPEDLQVIHKENFWQWLQVYPYSK